MLKNIFGKKQRTMLHAPVSGKVVPLEEVPDPVFSEKMMGEGIAITPTDGNIIAPFDGEIVQLPETKHAIGLMDKDGNEVLIHIGLDTVELKGEGFTAKVKAGDAVSAGQPLMELDLEYLQENAKSIVTPIVITNSANSGKEIQLTEEKEASAGVTVLLTITGK
ncbi:PTS sugar transporter subunit IIA [Oceanobacillus neutriphilus]|uniref:PTS glucose transporter subunit IIA n=1 Tax=Oceanobacillus neutriphilus TaxID=531815 RepID=A0ABQ2NPX9_9BACI|nr:PTS glucose transporter subunit IIA [Oceanobacillus neutriphilus]GGP07818.1 PTS glucose transporter subunit IIA [Oceanobacillus neutriphilus]